MQQFSNLVQCHAVNSPLHEPDLFLSLIISRKRPQQSSILSITFQSTYRQSQTHKRTDYERGNVNYGRRVCSNRVVHADASPKTVAWPKTVHRRKKQVAERFSKVITVGFELFRCRTSEPITETNQLYSNC